jgi:hypothetical protein
LYFRRYAGKLVCRKGRCSGHLPGGIASSNATHFVDFSTIWMWNFRSKLLLAGIASSTRSSKSALGA